MTNSQPAATPLTVHPWVTTWEQETILASIAHDKVHIVSRTVSSENREMGVADPTARRREGFRAACGTTRRGRFLAVAAGTDVTCAKCAKYATL